MDSGHAPVPEGIDLEKPSAARIYDWYLDGNSHYLVDRAFGRRVVDIFPLIKPLAMINRRWLGRVVREALDAGITQFLDLGAGLPTVGAVHQFVRHHRDEHGGDGRVVYVDNEGVAASHARLLLEKEQVTDWAGVVQQDMRFTDRIFRDDTTRRLINWDEPVCLLAVAVFHFIGPADQPAELIDTYRRKLAPGSWFALSHLASDEADDEGQKQVREFVESYRDTQNPLWQRDKAEITAWFDGFDLLDPGVAHLTDWRPDPEGLPKFPTDGVRPFSWCAVGQRPSA